MLKENERIRCFGSEKGREFYALYHDEEWGNPVHEDRILFEFLILEGAQAGLSWEIILKKRAGYREVFHQFNPLKVAQMSDEELMKLVHIGPIIRNRLKVFAARQNAKVFLEIQKEWGLFATYLWHYVQGKPLKNHWKNLADIPKSTSLSDTISKDLKKKGMTFVGTTIIYSYLQAVGVINDHITSCWRYRP